MEESEKKTKIIKDLEPIFFEYGNNYYGKNSTHCFHDIFVFDFEIRILNKGVHYK